jgi:hypothetical protein
VGSYSETEVPRRLTELQKAMSDVGLWDVQESETRTNYEPATGEVRLGRVRLWRPQERHVDLDEVQATIESWGPSLVAMDVWQGEHMHQRLTKRNIPCLPVTFTSAAMQAMATAMLGRFKDRSVLLWPQSDVLRDLRAMKIADRGASYRLQWERNEHGHGDAGTSLALGMLGARHVDRCDANVIRGDLTMG